MNLSSTVKSIQDIMRKDDGVDGDAQRLGQLTWMLFLKVFDQREEEWEDDYKEKGETYKSPIPEKYRWRNWAAYKVDHEGKKQPQIAGSELTNFVNNELFPALKDNIDASASKQHKVIKQVFEDANNYMKSGPLILAIIEKLDASINFHDFKIKANIGDVYEQLLNDLRGAGNAGEFYTPRAITQFMVQMVNPRLDKRETVLDPACGTGGFLTASIDHFRTQINKTSSAEDKKAIEELIFGYEKKQLPHLLCTTNMLLHDIDVPSQIDHRNTLGKPWNDWTAYDKHDCVITNPPFGGYEDDGVGADYPTDLKTRETADMFMALMIKKLLKDNGRAAVVLPDGVLFGDGIKNKLKELLLRECNLHTIVRMPRGVFAPYTTIKTNLLFFTRKNVAADGNEQFATENIWFYEHPYPAGYKSYSKTKPIRIEEFEPEKAWWGSEENDFSEREENDFAWQYPFKEKRAEAIAAAQPHWEKAELLSNEAKLKKRQIKYLNDSIQGRTKDNDLQSLLKEQLLQVEKDINRSTTEASKLYSTFLASALSKATSLIDSNGIISSISKDISKLKDQVEKLELQAKDAHAAGERLYWPIYNLDIKNPNTPEEESHEPDVLLEKYKKLLGEIEETENTLKSELATALSHHFDQKGA